MSTSNKNGKRDRIHQVHKENRRKVKSGRLTGTPAMGRNEESAESTDDYYDALLKENDQWNFEPINDQIRRLKQVIKMLLLAKETQQLKEEALRNDLHSAKEKCTETDFEVTNVIDLYNSCLLELHITQKRLEKAESDKLSAIDECQRREREARLEVESLQASLRALQKEAQSERPVSFSVDQK